MTAAPELASSDKLRDWVDQHGYVAENALQVYADRMRVVAAEAAADGLASYARAFIESAEKAEAAAAALNAITDASMEAPDPE